MTFDGHRRLTPELLRSMVDGFGSLEVTNAELYGAVDYAADVARAILLSLDINSEADSALGFTLTTVRTGIRAPDAVAVLVGDVMRGIDLIGTLVEDQMVGSSQPAAYGVLAVGVTTARSIAVDIRRNPAKEDAYRLAQSMAINRELNFELESKEGAIRVGHRSFEFARTELGARFELYDWVASIIYALAAIDAGSNQRNAEPVNDEHADAPPNKSAKITIAPLAIVSFLDDPGAFDQAFRDTEQLIRALTQAAQERGTPDELAARASQHALDGTALMLGPHGEPREMPPSPRTVYGWTVDALVLLQAVKPPTGDAAQILAAIAATPDDEPRGLRQGLEVAAGKAYRREAGERIRKGSLDGLEDLAKRVVAHPIESASGVTVFAAALYDMTQGWPWLGSGLRVLLRLVQQVT